VTTRASALYRGRMRHTRLEPFHHHFEYRIYYGLFDIDELETLDRDLRLFSVGRFNLFGFDIAKHGPADGTPLRPWVDQVLSSAGVDADGGRVLLLAFPRVLGSVFDPISIWYCYGSGGDLRAILHEVRNTFGDRHTYVVPVEAEGLRHRFAKAMHVSPFNDLDQTYHFTVTEPGERLAFAIEQTDSSGTVFFRAGVSLTRLPFTDRELLMLFFTHPLLTVKVVGGIYWQALRLWLKGAKFHHRPEPPASSISVVDGWNNPR